LILVWKLGEGVNQRGDAVYRNVDACREERAHQPLCFIVRAVAPVGCLIDLHPPAAGATHVSLAAFSHPDGYVARGFHRFFQKRVARSESIECNRGVGDEIFPTFFAQADKIMEDREGKRLCKVRNGVERPFSREVCHQRVGLCLPFGHDGA